MFPRRRLGHHSLQAAVTETLENSSEESFPADCGRRHSHLRAQETEDCGLRASRRSSANRVLHGYLAVGSRERVVEEQGSCRLNSRERNLEEGDRRSRISSGRTGEDGGFSRRDSRRIGEGLGQESTRGHDGHRQSSPCMAVRGDSSQRSSNACLGEVAGQLPRDSRGAVSEDAWVGVPETRGPRTSDSGDRGIDDRSGSWEGADIDGSHRPSSSWGGVSDDRGYEASDSSRVSISEDSSRRLSGFWERESEEDPHFRDSWEKREDRGPRASEGESSCCSSRGSCVGASEDRCSSWGLGSTPPQSPSVRAKDQTMPGVASAGPSKSSREPADASESCCPLSPLFLLQGHHPKPLLIFSFSSVTLPFLFIF